MIDQTSTSTSPSTDAGVGGLRASDRPADDQGSDNDGQPIAMGSQAGGSTSIEVRAESALHTDKGTTTIAEGVVSKIVGMAAREVAGIHSMGSGSGRAMGAVKDLLPGSSSSVTEGVSVEVGATQAAADLSLVTIYGAAIQDVAQAVRDNVIRRVQEMTGLQMVEVNIAVTDVNVPADGAGASAGGPAQAGSHQRVQ